MAGASFQPHSVMVLEFQTSNNAHRSHDAILPTFPKHLKTITNTLCWWSAGKRAEATGGGGLPFRFTGILFRTHSFLSTFLLRNNTFSHLTGTDLREQSREARRMDTNS